MGPDCKIYIRPGSTTYSFHIINRPDEKGVECELIKNAIRFPKDTYSASANFPNHPQFRVDEEEKCDPNIRHLFGREVIYVRKMNIYPNPTVGQLNLEIPNGLTGDVVVYNQLGKLVFQKYLFQNENSLNLSQLPAGIYIVEFEPQNNTENILYSSKLILE